MQSDQQRYGEDISSFKNELTPEKRRESFVADGFIRQDQSVTIAKLLCSARFTMAALSSSLCYFTYSFLEPILAERLATFDLTSPQIGLFFVIQPVFYIPTSVLVQYIPRRVEKRVTIIVATLLTGVAFIFVGPSEVFGLPDSLVVMGVGQAAVGVFSALMMIPGLPEMVESTIPLYPGQERQVNDISAGLYNAFLGFGQVVAPAYGALVSEALGFRLTSDIVALICFIFGAVYFALAGGFTVCSNLCQPHAQSKSRKESDSLWLYDVDSEIEREPSQGRRLRSGFLMLGPTSLEVSRLRLESTMRDYSPLLSQPECTKNVLVWPAMTPLPSSEKPRRLSDVQSS